MRKNIKMKEERKMAQKTNQIKPVSFHIACKTMLHKIRLYPGDLRLRG
jgi:hypothetical protein